MKEPYCKGASDSIWALSLASAAARLQPKRRQGYRWAELLSFEKGWIRGADLILIEGRQHGWQRYREWSHADLLQWNLLFGEDRMQLKEAVEQFINGYFSTCKRSEKTQAAYKIDLAQLQGHIGGTELLAAIEPERLECWAADMRSDGCASVSIRRKFATARIFFGYWVRKGTLERSPLWRIRLDLGRERMLPRNLAPSDAKRLMEEVWRQVNLTGDAVRLPNDPGFLRLRDLAAMEILFATGMRVGELVKLRLQDWRADDGSLVVSGKGSRQRLALLPDDRSLLAAKTYISKREGMSLGHDGFSSTR